MKVTIHSMKADIHSMTIKFNKNFRKKITLKIDFIS